MPLVNGKSTNAVRKNIEILMRENKPQKQAIAIALDIARRAKRAMGGELSQADWTERAQAHSMMKSPVMAAALKPKPPISPVIPRGTLAATTPLGQSMPASKLSIPKANFPKIPNPPPPPKIPQAATTGTNPKLPKIGKKSGGEVKSQGPLLGSTPGRADKLPVDVEDGAYVLPADCVSALGDGNSLAGHAAIEHMVSQLPHAKSNGGKASSGKSVPCMLSDGEHLLSRETVEQIGGGDYEKGKRVLDHFVTHVRHQTIRKLSKLPPPADSRED